MKTKVLIPTVLCGVLLTASAMAFPWSDKGEGPRGDNGPQMRQEMTAEQHAERVDQQLKRMSILLKLDDQQQAQMKEVFNQDYQNRQERDAAMQATHDAMLAYRLDDKFDEAKFRDLAEKEAAVKVDMLVEQEKQRNEIRSILTEEQLGKLEKLQDMDRGPRAQGDRGDREGRGERGPNGDEDGRGGKGGRALLNQDAVNTDS